MADCVTTFRPERSVNREMSDKSRTALATFALLTVVVGCGNVPADNAVATAASIPVTVITNTGFGGGASNTGIVAAPSLTDLLGLVHGLGFFYPRLDECTRVPQFRAQCWLDVKDPGNSLLVAAYVDVPCTVTQSVTAALSLPTEVTIVVVSTPACQNGGYAAPTANLSLLAIPLTLLPVDEVTVNVLHIGISVPTAKMMVDLRRPLNLATDMQARTNEFHAATTAATNDALTRVPPGQTVSFVAFGTNRWTETSLGCPVPGEAYQLADARGYVIFLRGSDQPQLDMEYHVSGTYVAFCGRVAS
jgi:hypothetical protein